MKTNEEKELFYKTVSKILNIDHKFHLPVTRKTRWNTRFLGNGRFPGFGLVQCYGDVIRVISKKETKLFRDYESVYSYLKSLTSALE